jgi:hypothetical protein
MYVHIFFFITALLIFGKSKVVTGEVGSTCDAWQADNADAYFAITGHWIEEEITGEWKEQHALLGFTQMNTAHNGIHLGQALFKNFNRLNIVHKVLRTYSLYSYS